MKKLLFFSVFLLVVLSACSIPGNIVTGPSDNSATQQAVIDQAVQATATSGAVQTLIATLQTQAAQPEPGVTVIVVTNTAAPETATAVPPTATATAVPPTATATTPPTATQVPPTATPAPPTATPTPTTPCNSIEFVADVTVPDGTLMAPGSTFVKTWRLRNTGTCTWTTAYDLVFTGGSQMNAPAAVDMPGTVAPGQTIDVSVTFVAPIQAGTYRSSWKLRDGSGQMFGVGRSGVNFYTEIRVGTINLSVPFDMAANYCLAEWSSGGERLPCPGENNDSRGFVRKLDRPALETGYIDDEAALLTHPRMINDSVIRGVYPALRVETGYHFTGIVGCEYEATACDVTFLLEYQIGSGAITTLKSWSERYEKMFTTVDVDLSGLAGQDVKFILTVHSNGSTSGDRALWLAPQIVKK